MACLRDARNFLIENIRTFSLKIWLPVLLFSVLLAVFILFRLPNIALRNWGLENPWASWGIQTLVYLGLLVASLVFNSTVYNGVNEYGKKKNLWRYFQYFLVTMVAGILLILILRGATALSTALSGAKFSSTMETVILGAYAMVGLAIGLAITIPLFYIAPKYLMEKDTKWKTFFTHFATGFRHWGMLFLTALLSTLIAGIILLVLAAPSLILAFAQTSSQLGMLEGDEAGLPGYYLILTFLVFTLTGILYAALATYVTVTFIYVYGSIETQEKNKKEKKNNDDEKDKDTLY